MPDIEITSDELKNGWTEASLKTYLEERAQAQAARVLDRKPPRPRWANNKYNPHFWRSG